MSFVYAPPDTPLAILHADDRIVVADKPSGLLSVPGRGDDKADCLIERLRVEYPDILLIHRLDLDTSGVMIFARDKAAQGKIGQQFEKRLVRKVYVALLDGHLRPDTGEVDLPLIVDWPNRPRQHVNMETGRPARTGWQVLGHEGATTRVHLFPVTGRTHQLRVHMAATGHAILGDPLYAEGAAQAHPRLMLHAGTLRIRHPATGRSMTFDAPVPF